MNYSFNKGVEAAKNGTNINNSYPFIKPSKEYWDWLDGYRSIKLIK